MTQTDLASRGALLTCATSLAVLLCTDANARDPGMSAYMIRVLACDGVDAKMEVYLPQSLVDKGYQAVRPRRSPSPVARSTSISASARRRSAARSTTVMGTRSRRDND